MKNFKKGFSLAEILIAVTVIGLIAAITLPSLQTNIRKRAFGASAAKVYNTISNAVNEYMTDEDVDDIAQLDFNIDRFYSYFKNRPESSFANRYTNRAGAVLMMINGNDITLADGMALRAEYNNNCINFLIDTNGREEPNVLSMDYWRVSACGNGIVDGFGVAREATRNAVRDAQCPNGNGCFGYLIRNNFKIDY